MTFWVQSRYLVGFMLLICFVFYVVRFVLFVFVLCIVCRVLPLSLDFPFLIAPSVFSNIYKRYILCWIAFKLKIVNNLHAFLTLRWARFHIGRRLCVVEHQTPDIFRIRSGNDSLLNNGEKCGADWNWNDKRVWRNIVDQNWNSKGVWQNTLIR